MFGFGKRSEGILLKGFDPHLTPTQDHFGHAKLVLLTTRFGAEAVETR